MYKKIVLVLLIVFMLVLCGCSDLGVGDAIALDEDMHIEFNHIDDVHIEFRGNIYYLSHIKFLWGEKWNLEADEEYEYLGWTGSRFWYKSHIFAESKENSTFLYSTNTESTYLKEDFDYKTESFSINGTDIVFVFNDDLLECEGEQAEIFGKFTSDIVISSISCPKLRARLSFFDENNEWYAASNNMIKFKLSDHLVELLEQNNLLYAD